MNDDHRDGYSKQYRDGRLSSVNLFSNGERIKYYSYYDNLALARQDSCSNNMQDCVVKEWYKNGNQKSISSTIQGIRVGNWKTWYENGTLGSNSNYNNEGEYDGKFETWYYDGKVKSCSIWSNNIYIGDCD